MSQPAVEPGRRFAFDSFALAEELGSTLKFSGSGRRLFELAYERQQLRELELVKFLDAQRLLAALVLQSHLVGLAIRSSAEIHVTSRGAAQFVVAEHSIADCCSPLPAPRISKGFASDLVEHVRLVLVRMKRAGIRKKKAASLESGLD